MSYGHGNDMAAESWARGLTPEQSSVLPESTVTCPKCGGHGGWDTPAPWRGPGAMEFDLCSECDGARVVTPAQAADMAARCERIRAARELTDEERAAIRADIALASAPRTRYCRVCGEPLGRGEYGACGDCVAREIAAGEATV